MINKENYKYSDLTEKIIGQIFVVYNTLGHGFLEKIYRKALLKKLREIGLKAYEEYPIKVSFEGEVVGDYFADILVEEKVILELKAAECLNAAFEAQLINYLKATGFEVGLLVNFGKKLEIKRKVFSADHKKSVQSAAGVS
jgi:GxxExxY protein